MYTAGSYSFLMDPWHWATNPMFCYDGTCKNVSKYYGDKDSTIDGTTISDCVYFFFKRPTSTEKEKDRFSSINGNISSDWGDCMIFDKAYIENELGFKDSDYMRGNNSLLHVGISSCLKGRLDDQWWHNITGDLFPT